MESGHMVPRRRKIGVLFMLVGLLTGTFSVFGPLADASPVPPGVIGNFEIDGDQGSPPGGTLDWVDFVGEASLAVLTDAVGPDDGLQGSSKEDEPEDFTCQYHDPTVTPGKDDLVRAYINTRVSGPASIFLDLGFVRADGGVQGDSHVNFEFNQNPVSDMCPYVGRSDGDLLITFDFPGNTADPADVQTFSWDADAPDGPDNPGKWVPFTFNGNVAAEDNAAQITDEVVGGTIAARAFGEATIDLVALAEATGGDGECASFGFASIRSRSSGQSFSSALQDIMGGPVDVSTCGKIIVHKTDDAGNQLAGATFGLWPAAASVPAVGVDGTRPSTGSIGTCTSLADGSCTFDDVNPGDYKVAELTPPAGYAIDPDIVNVTVGFRETVDVEAPFVDPRHTGFVRVTKAVTDGGQPFDIDPADLAGLTFILEQGGVQVNTWPPPGSPAQCTLNGSSLFCDIGPVPLGDYVVTEDPTTLPDGMSQGPDVNVTIDEDGETVQATITNPLNPININLEKAGPDTANVGDVIDYTFDVSTTGEPLTITQLVEIIALPTYDNRCDTTSLTGPDKSITIDPDNDGDGVLELGETWRWTCQHTVTFADATDSDGELLQNKAEVTGEDSFGRDVSDDDTHVLTILLPDVSVEKTPDDGVILPGDTAEFTIVVSNAGPGRANDVTLSDSLPDGIDWADDSADCTIAPDVGTVGQVLSCDFGDLDAGKDVTVHVSGATDTADCGELPNTATVAASNELAEDEANNSDDGLITVSCADVTVLKTADDEVINAGDTASFTIVVTNLSATADATDVTLSDSLPNGIDWAVSGADASDCSITPDVGTVGQMLSCDFGTVEPSGTRTITVSGDTDAADCGTLPNAAVVASTNEAEGAGDNNESSDTITVECPNVWVEKTGPATVNANDTITWTITFGNDGAGDAYDVVLSDTLPAGLTGYVLGGTDAAFCELAGSTVTCEFTVMLSGASHSITVTGTTDAADCGDVTNPVVIRASNEAQEDLGDNSDEATTEVLCPDIGITKVADDDVVNAGDQIGFTITVANAGPGVAYGVTLNDPLPAGDGIDWSIQSQSGGASCAISGAPGAEVLTCGSKDLAPGASFSVHVVSDTDPTTEVCVSATLDNTAIADASNDAPVQATARTAIQCPNIVVTKVADDASVSAGEQIGFQITVSNTGPGIAYGTTLNDPMPAGVDWVIESQSGGASCSLTAGDDLSCGPVDLAAGESFTVHLVAATTEADCALYENTATADADNDAPLTASDDTTVKCPGLNIVKDADDPETVSAGDPIGFTIEVTNDPGEGVGTAFDVTLNDPLPAGDGVSWSIQSQTGGAGCVVSGTAPTQTLACGPIDLDPGEGFSVHVVSDTQPTGAECVSAILENEATADATNHAAITANDTITIQCPDITITKVADADVVDAGQDVGFTITVDNAGPGTAYDVTISDPLPAGAGVVWSVDPAVEGCTILLGTLLCDVGDLGAEDSFSVHVTGTTPGGIGNPNLPAACKVYDNTATVSLANDADESASDSTQVICPLDITIVKGGPALAHRGDQITYTFTVTNSGEADLVDVDLTDPICDAGTLTLVDDADGDTTLAVGEVWTYSCTRIITATDPDPLPNTATVVGTDVRGRTTDDTDDHVVDLITPAIQVVKTVDDATPDVGQTVTFTYVVTNTGDTTLFNVTVVDDRLGAIGTIPELAAGASATLTKTMVVAADSPTLNIATATGADVLGKKVTDDDPETITIVLPEVIVRPAVLPRTGASSQLLLLLSGMLLLVGGLLVASGEGLTLQTTRRRQS